MNARTAIRLVCVLTLVGLGLTGAGCGGGSTPMPPTPVLTVTAISPNRGATIGTTEVTLTGVAFASGMTVTIGGTAATNVRVQSSTSALAVAGPHGAGQVDVSVANGAATSTLASGFAYIEPSPAVLPQIQGFTVQGPRPNEPAGYADIGELISVTANVLSPGTPVANLTFDWSADAGTFSGSGPSVTWRAPTQVTAPADIPLTLKVSKSLEVARSVYPISTVGVSATTNVHVVDTVKTVSDLSVRFLTNFSVSAIKPEVVVQEFWDGCFVGKGSELTDVQNNRENFDINSYAIGPVTDVLVNFSGSCAFRNSSPPDPAPDACIAVVCEWHDTYKPTGRQGVTIGIDHLTAVYRNQKWWLCDSGFEGTQSSSSAGQAGVPMIRFIR